MTENAIVKAESYAVVERGVEAVNEIIKENLGLDKMQVNDLEKIKVPTGGSLSFDVPTLTGEESVKDFEGVIIAWKVVRSYWDKEFDGSKEPPVCYSDGGESGFGKPNGEAENGWHDCSACNKNEWDTGKDGIGKACSEKRLYFLVRKDDMIPVVVVAPATSVKNVRQYFLKLAGKAIPFYGVVTKFSLEKAESTKGIKYSKLVPTATSILAEKDRELFKAMAVSLKPFIESYRYDEQDGGSQNTPNESGEKSA